MLRKLFPVNSLRYWLLAWGIISAIGSILITQQELVKLREAFETDARIVHRLLSQRAVQHEAILATLALLQPSIEATAAVQKLPALYPQILKVQRHDKDTPWAETSLAAAETLSHQTGRATLADVDFGRARYQLVLWAEPSSFAMQMDLRAVVPWSEWPMSPEGSPVRVSMEYAGQTLTLQPGRQGGGGWHFEFRKHLAADSQPFDVVAQREVSWLELPWIWILSWWILVALSLIGFSLAARQRQQRLRAEELLRLGQIARLNTMGELAAGMAHEINQPLTAMLANTQAAARLLSDQPPEVTAAQSAMTQAVAQARRATGVVTRLRRMIERPNETKPPEAISLKEAVTNALHLLEPELQRLGITTQTTSIERDVIVMAESIALEQIIHNLLMNSIQALEQMPITERHLILDIRADRAQGALTLTDTGPGIAADVLPRLFEPFFSTRTDGLGLGLSLCESLANRMGGELSATTQMPHGASFCLRLPLGQT